jgi:hypothetical protein
MGFTSYEVKCHLKEQQSRGESSGYWQGTPLYRELGFTKHVSKHTPLLSLSSSAPAVAAKKDDASAADQAALTNVAGSTVLSAGGGLIQTTDG